MATYQNNNSHFYSRAYYYLSCGRFLSELCVSDIVFPGTGLKSNHVIS